LVFETKNFAALTLVSRLFEDYYGGMDESKKPVKKVRPPKLYELRLLENPYEAFQKGPITKHTTFLRLLKKEDDSYRVIWLYSSNKTRLANFLLQVVCFLTVNQEYEVVKEKDKNDLENYDFGELCTFALTQTLFSETGIAPEIYAQLMEGGSELKAAIAKEKDLNLASVNLMNATASFFYSLTWNFYDYGEAFKALQQAIPVPFSKIEESTLCLDKSI
jgi:hypothetical protein